MPEANQDPQDPFTTAPAEDPFATGTTALADEISEQPIEPETIEPETVPSEAAVGIPTVDAEGNVLDPGQPATEEAPAVQEPPQQAPEPPQAVEPPQEAPQAPEATAVAPPPPVPEPVAAPPAPPPPVTPAAPPAPSDGTRPVGPRGGKGEMRYYKLLYLSGPDTFTNFDLATVPDDIGVTVCKYAPPKELEEVATKKAEMANASGEKLAKLQADVKAMEALHQELWFEARNNEHANRLGFAIMGRPKEGAKIFPVPRGAWKPKFVKPAPPAPARERVVIT